MTFEKKNIPKKSENLSQWYHRVILEAELADYGPAKGTMIFRPYGYAIWELIQKELDKKIKDKGVDNAYFPMLIPESLINKEKQHIKGFSPELAIVTIGGGQKLTEKLVIRPTSETIIYDSFAKWISSWRDLPIQLNQWCNIVRWEKRTYPFLRTSEFLWQEGHTAHTSHKEATNMVNWAIEVYKDIYQNFLALAGYVGSKSDLEKFAGADKTMAYETLMPSGKALQSATSHDLGQNFSKTFNINYQDKKGKNQYVWQTSWGISTRCIGGMIMAHGDDNGLRLPPKIAPVQVVIVPVKNDKDLLKYANKVYKIISEQDIRVKLDDRDDETMGYKINKWELRGAPIRIEIGPKELKEQNLTIVRRDNGEKINLKFFLISKLNQLLDDIHDNLLKDTKEFLDKNTFDADNFDQFKKIMKTTKGFIRANWCEDIECETKIKELTKATTRCKTNEKIIKGAKCLYCDRNAKAQWLFAQAY
ncbi:MAG: proline--tRNA ligase [bacterium]|nr:proline--tRNA ligase [bacterium]